MNWACNCATPKKRFSYRADLVATLERVCDVTGYPKTIRVDRGSEFISRDLDPWAYAKGVTLDFSRLGKPTDNAFIEAFNGRLRAECLNAHWFLTLADASEKLEDWHKYYNEGRPHGAIGNKSSVSLMTPTGASSPRRDKGRENLPSGGSTLGSRPLRPTLWLQLDERRASQQRPYTIAGRTFLKRARLPPKHLYKSNNRTIIFLI